MTIHRVFTLSDSFIQILDSDNLQVCGRKKKISIPIDLFSYFQPIPNLKLKNVLTFAISTSSDLSQGGYVDVRKS